MATKPKTKLVRTKKRKFFNKTIIIYISSLLVGVLFFLPSLLILSIGALPTLLLKFFDKTPDLSLTKSVFYTNIIGIFVVIIGMWTGDNTTDGAILILYNIDNLTIMYGSAIAGALLFLVIPIFVSYYISFSYKNKMNNLRFKQKEILEKWGSEITSKVEARPEVLKALENCDKD